MTQVKQDRTPYSTSIHTVYLLSVSIKESIMGYICSKCKHS